MAKFVKDGIFFTVDIQRGRIMANKYSGAAMAAVHETAAGLHRAGGIDRRTMRKFDALCLTPVQKMTPRKIRALRTEKRPARLSLPPTST
jgi:hypothetical protein